MAIPNIINSTDDLLRIKLTKIDDFKYGLNKEGICSALFSFIFGRIISIEEVKRYIVQHPNSSINTTLKKRLEDRGISVLVYQSIQPLTNQKSSTDEEKPQLIEQILQKKDELDLSLYDNAPLIEIKTEHNNDENNLNK